MSSIQGESIEKIEKNEYFVDTSSGVTIYTAEKKLEDSATSDAILLIHGLGGGYAYWDLDFKDYSMMELLARDGFDVFAVDQRGFGRSTKPDALEVTIEACTEDLKSIIDFIKSLRHLEKVHIVGHSFGAELAVCLAGKYGDHVGKVVPVACPYKIFPASYQEGMNGWTEQLKKGVRYYSTTHHLTMENNLYSYEEEVVDTYKDFIDRLYLEVPIGAVINFGSFKHSKYVSNITAPTLLINGALDPLIDHYDAMQCFDDLGTNEKALLVIGNASHFVFLEKAARKIMYQAMVSWLHS